MAVDLLVELADGSLWHPWHGPLHQSYRFRYREDREYRLHSAATGLLYRQLLDGPLLDWLSGYPSLWAPLLINDAKALVHTVSDTAYLVSPSVFQRYA